MLPVRHDVNMDKSLSSQRWLARLSFVLAGLAIVVLAVFGGLKSLAMLAVAVAAAVVSLAAAYFFLSGGAPGDGCHSRSSSCRRSRLVSTASRS